MDDLLKTNWDELAKLDVRLNRFLVVKPSKAEDQIRNDVVLDLKNYIKSRIIELSQ